jgi:hypothetical protein
MEGAPEHCAWPRVSNSVVTCKRLPEEINK